MAGARQTWDLDDFGGGLDRRDGLWSSRQSRWRDLHNAFIDKGRKPRRRWPAVRDDIILDLKCQGLLFVDGVYHTIARKGDSVSHAGTAASLVQTLYFDNPDLCTTWTLGEFGVFDGYAVAWIIHDFPSTTYPKRAFLHVWDGLLYAPTYVQDPYLPGNFSPSIADLTGQRYDPAFRPALGTGVSKVWTSTLRGNAHCSRTADGRVWNQKDVDGLKQDGESYCFVVPEGAGVVRRFLVPRNAADLKVDAKWAYYVLEKAVGTAWVPMPEVDAAPTVDGTWQAVSLASRFAGGWNEIAVDVRWDEGGAGLVRLRLVVGAPGVEVTTNPAVTVVAGAGSSWRLHLTDMKWRHRDGDGQTTTAHNTDELTPGRIYLLAATADGAAFPELTDITSGFPNGWQREHLGFFKRVVAPAAQTGSTVANPSWASIVPMTGTVTVVAGGAAITGAGTAFGTEIAPGDAVIVNGETKTIDTRTSNTDATILGTWASNAGPGAAIDKQVPHYAAYTGGDTLVSLNLTDLVAGQSLRVGTIDYTISEVVSAGVYKVTKNGASGDYTGALDGVHTVYAADKPVVSDYLYAFESDADNAWYTNLIMEYNGLAGSGDALSISTAAQDNTGGGITSISTVRNRMLVTYAGSMQAWSIDQATNATAFLDTLSFGTEAQDRPSPVPFYGAVVVPTAAGFRAINLVGVNLDNLQDTNIGEPVASLPPLTVRAAAYWPHTGQMVVAGIRDGDLVFQVLDYSKDSKITAWSTWTVGGITDVDAGTMIADGARLRWRSGRQVYHFDAAATLFRDFNDIPGEAYESFGRLHYNDLGKPGYGKRFVAFDIIQDGTCTIGFDIPPFGSFDESGGPNLTGPVVVGTTYGRARLPLALTGPAVALVFRSRSEDGWRLQRIALDFLLLRR